MRLPEKLTALKDRAEDQLDILNSKEKTQNALLLPFFDALGYDAFNVREVEPNHVVELDQEGAREVDYAVRIGGTPAMLFQCQEATGDLEAFDPDPLFRHFGELPASLVVLTNGLTYRFFADLGEGTSVDGRPFFEFDLLDYEPEQVTYLELLTKTAFDTEEVLAAAFELKYTRLLQNYLVRQRESPDKHFVRFLAAQIYEGRVSEGVLERFRPVVQRLLGQFDMEQHEIRQEGSTRPNDGGQVKGANELGSTRQPDATSQSEDRTQTPTMGQPENTSQPDRTSGPDDQEVLAEEEIDVKAHLQEMAADKTSNGEQEEAVDGAGKDPENSNPASGTPEDEALEDDNLEGEDLDSGESEGGSLAEQFANKVVGDS